MRNRRILVLSGLLALAATPLASHAADPDKALAACIKNFVETTVPKDRVVRVKKPAMPVPSAAFRGRGKYTFELTARGLRSGEQLSQARCVANPEGYVILIDTKTDETLFAG